MDRRVGDPILHGGKARAGKITKPGRLDGSRLPGKYSESVALGVAGQIDENIDLVLPNQPGRLVVAETVDGVPLIGEFAEAFRAIVGRWDVSVAEYFDGPTIMRRQNRADKVGDGVSAKVGRDISHPQPGRSWTPWRHSLERGKPLFPFARLGQNGRG